MNVNCVQNVCKEIGINFSVVMSNMNNPKFTHRTRSMSDTTKAITIADFLHEEKMKGSREVTGRQIAQAQQQLNINYQKLFEQYQALQKELINEKLAHQHETQQLIKLRQEIERISKILKEVGLIV